MATHVLFDVDPFALTICKSGANRQRIFLRKSKPDEQTLTLPHREGILKSGDDWTAFYCVVAEPDTEEDGGQGAPGVVDVWRDETEIRKAAHRFARNKGYVNAMHDALEEQGCTVVENAVALTDFQVGEHTIRKGSWYVAIEPSPEFRAAVERGDITGVSMEGSGLREVLAKASFEGAKKCPSCNGKVKMDAAECPNCHHKFSTSVKKVPSSTFPDLERAPGKKDNWVERAGGLPRYIERIAKHLHYERGMTISHAIAAAVNQVKKWAAGGEGVTAETQAKAAKALAEWEAKKARSKLSKGATMSLMRKIAESVGLSKEQIDEALTDEDLTDEERAALEAIPAKPGTVEENSEEDDDVADNERLDQIEAKITKANEDNSSAIASLTGLVEKLVEHSTKQTERKDEEPDAKAIKKSLDDLAADVKPLAERIEKMQADVDALAEGGSEQHDEDDDTVRRSSVKKSDAHPLAGLLD